ncbi:MAG: flagellar biosynthetic protein FliR, partial [Lachnospiraceae bacterium]|nr:flagellar biosynthetic protein FliR [Lachnospiraceae bacterium]
MMEYTFSLAGFERFLLVFVRLATFVFIAPFFSDRGVPNITKIGLAGIISIMVVYAVPLTETPYETVWGYAVLVVKEATVGLLIGYSAAMCNTIIVFAGNLIDMDIGLSMVSEFDPSMNVQMTVTAQIYYYGMLLLMLVTDFHQYLLKAVSDSFELIPLGGAQLDYDHLLGTFTEFITNVFVIGFRIMLPVFASMLVVNCVLGIMAKVAPQMNMFSVGIQIKLLAGLAVMLV